MARSKTGSKSKKSNKRGESRVATPPASAAAPREIRPYIYAGFDLLLVVVWAVLLTWVIPNRHASGQAVLWLMVLLGVVMGAGMLVRNRWGWRLGAAACGALIVMWIGLVIVLLMTAGFLSGVYGGFGQAAALGTIGIALLTLQLVALLPAFQLKFLMTRAGRRHFGLEPLWRK